MKEFAVAAAASDEDEAVEQPTEFKVGEDIFRAYKPSSGQIGIMAAQMSGGEMDQMAGIINLFLGVLDHESATIATRRLMDRDDPFELQQVSEIMSWLMEEWSGRPTPPSSGSSSSQRAVGRKSTGNAHAGASTR